MIKNRPAFDLDKLYPGDVISAVSSEWRAVNNSYKRNIILLEVEPMRLKGVYYSPDSSEYILEVDTVYIHIDEVTKGKVAIYKLGGKGS